MSGLEIGGLVLGAFPLVVTAIEQYKKGLEIIRLWETKNYEKELAAIQLEIEVQGTIFRNTYLILLRSLVDQQSIVKLLMEPNGFEEYGVLIGPPLKAHLGPQWEMYSKLMEQLQNLLNTLRLHIDKTRPTNAEDAISKISSALKPIRFSFGIRQRHGLLHNIKEANSAFRTLVEQRDAMKDFAQPIAANAQVSRYRYLRGESSTLLSLLSSHFDSWTWNSRRHIKVWVDSHLRPALESPVLSEERAVYTVTTCSKHYCCAGSLCQTRGPVPEPLSELRCRHWAHWGGPVCFPATTQQQHLSTAPNKATVSASPNSIRNFQHATFNVCERYPLPTDISLHTIMSSGTHYQWFPGYFYERDRVNIATLAALSVVCLHNSNWLDSSFSSSQVFFALRNDNISQRSLLEPYVKKQHFNDTVPPPLAESESSLSAQTPAEPPTTFGIRNRALYNLGIMLLELVLNETLSSLRVPGSNGASETEDQVAWRLEREVCGRAGPVWADVVSKCLHCPFGGYPHLDDDVFASAVYTDIVQPLLDMMDLLDGRLGALSNPTPTSPFTYII
ncbi:hypothetical protein AnigIFM56816_009467 [Aspergillus niger]|nr:hypothetical protein AnigIFM56816_009467 [Aspergillus niger]